MTRHLRHAARFVTGIVLVLVGIAGLLLPILPGWAFLIPGMVLLADYIPPLRRLLDWAEAKFRDRVWPWMGRRFPRFHAWVDGLIRRASAEAEPHLRKYRKSPDESGEQS